MTTHRVVLRVCLTCRRLRRLPNQRGVARQGDGSTRGLRLPGVSSDQQRKKLAKMAVDPMNEKEAERVRKLVQDSGFPLQLAVQESVESASHGWNVETHEHPWASGDNAGFIDLVLEREQLFLVIECKHASRSKWIFLCARDAAEQRKARFRHSVVPQVEPTKVGYSEQHPLPASLESEFCVIEGSGGDRRRLLEHWTGPLLASMDAFADETDRGAKWRLARTGPHAPSEEIYYGAAIVTTAPLYSCRLDPTGVSLSDGVLPADVAVTRERWVRFTKPLVTNGTDPARPDRLRDIRTHREL